MQDIDDIIKEASAGRDLAYALDKFFYDLYFTAPEAVGMRIDQLGRRISEPMKVFGFPKESK